VVAVHKIEDVVKSPHKLVLRESMKKFTSNHREIEVLNFSHQTSSGSLNKQIIILLHSLGVPYSVGNVTTFELTSYRVLKRFSHNI
jgi:hypothetical protein